MKNIECILDWPTFCGVEDGKITVIPYFGDTKILIGDTITCSHLDKKIVKRVGDITLKNPKTLSDIYIKKMGFESVDSFLSYFEEITDSFAVVLVEFDENNYFLNTSTFCYNPEYDDKPWRNF